MVVLANLEFFFLFVSITYFDSQSNRCLFLPFSLLTFTNQDHEPEEGEINEKLLCIEWPFSDSGYFCGLSGCHTVL